MKILNRKEFLLLDNPTLFIKCDEWGNPEDELSVSYGQVSEGSNDFVSVGLHSFVKEWGTNQSCQTGEECHEILMKAVNNKEEFEWDYTMNGRDGLYDDNQLFMVYSALDLLKLIRELNSVYDSRYNKD